jgi:hypothetical protein
MKQLMILSDRQALEFIIDDLGSMQCATDSIDPLTCQPMSCWKEASLCLKDMIEILAYLPFNSIFVEFLNCRDQIVLTRQGRVSADFIQDTYSKINAVFAWGPVETTHALEKLQESLIQGQGKWIAHYFFGGGNPNSGVQAQKEIINIFRNHHDPAGIPMTFVSCTNEDDQVKWMKDANELVVLFVSNLMSSRLKA